MSTDGWIKLWRKIEDSDVWELSPISYRIWSWILLHAGRESHIWNGISFEPGELLTSYASIADGVAWKENRKTVKPSIKTVRCVLKSLEVRQALRHEPRHGGNWIKVLHWEDYQGDSKTTRAGTRAATKAEQGQDQGTIQEGKKIEEENKHLSDFDTFWTLYPKKESKGKARDYWLGALKKASSDEIISGLRRQLPVLSKKYKDKEQRQWMKLPGTWLNQECWNDELPTDEGIPARVFSGMDEYEIVQALALRREGKHEEAQMSVSEELWAEVRRRDRA